ncbi:MAG: ABC transporter ATP-binding protein [Anaerolineae bacterium]|nr:ABC transporter ATP-binding protein [Anaerolineae bacterium]
MIVTKGLTKRFGENLAVSDLTLEVARGEVFGFLGPNGAGKTTTVRMLSALIGASAGSASVNGYDVQAQAMDVRRTVGVLTETPGMYDRLSAEYNLRIYAELYEVPAPEKAVEKYLSMLGLWERRREPVGGFSKGMKQKLAIARALLHEPQTVFLDEPTSGLDPVAARTVREFIDELKTEGRTIFLTTHNLDEAERLCDRIGVMRSSLIALDSPDALRARLFGQHVRCQIANLTDAHRAAAAALPFVREARLSEGALLVDVAQPEQDNPALVAALVGAGAAIQYVQLSQASLEDVYMELVNGDAGEGARA